MTEPYDVVKFILYIVEFITFFRCTWIRDTFQEGVSTPSSKRSLCICL